MNCPVDNQWLGIINIYNILYRDSKALPPTECCILFSLLGDHVTTCVHQLCTTSPIFSHFPTASSPLMMRATTEVAVIFFCFCFYFYFLNTNFFSNTNQCNDDANEDDTGHAMT